MAARGARALAALQPAPSTAPFHPPWGGGGGGWEPMTVARARRSWAGGGGGGRGTRLGSKGRLQLWTAERGRGRTVPPRLTSLPSAEGRPSLPPRQLPQSPSPRRAAPRHPPVSGLESPAHPLFLSPDARIILSVKDSQWRVALNGVVGQC